MLPVISRTDFNFINWKKNSIKRNGFFSATGHGNGAYDGIGGFSQHFATTHNLSAPLSELIKNADHFVKYVSEYTSKIRNILLKTEELQNFELKRPMNGKKFDRLMAFAIVVFGKLSKSRNCECRKANEKTKHPRMAHC